MLLKKRQRENDETNDEETETPSFNRRDWKNSIQSTRCDCSKLLACALTAANLTIHHDRTTLKRRDSLKLASVKRLGCLTD